MMGDRDRNGGRRGQAMDDVERDAGRDQPHAAATQEKQVEPPVEDDQERQGAARQPSISPKQPDQQEHRRAGPDPVSPTEVESRRAGTVLEYEPKPRDTATEQVCLRHVHERPVLEVLALDLRVEKDATSLRVNAHPELDVLHRRLREALFVESTESEKDVTPDRTEAGPERRCGPGAILMDVMVEKVPEVGHDAPGPRIVVVGAEYRREPLVIVEGTTNPGERVGVNLHVRVDEDEDIATRLPRAEIARARGTEMAGPVDDDQLLGWP